MMFSGGIYSTTYALSLRVSVYRKQVDPRDPRDLYGVGTGKDKDKSEWSEERLRGNVEESYNVYTQEQVSWTNFVLLTCIWHQSTEIRNKSKVH